MSPSLKPPDFTHVPTRTPARLRNALYASGTDSFDVALEDLDVNLTTPQSLQILSSRYDHLDRLVSPNPGVYNWGSGAYEVNTGTAPVTAGFFRARGNSVYTVSSSGRAYGKDPQMHGIEITAGTFPTIATATRVNGSDTLRDIDIDQDSKGGRFDIGGPITGTGIPGSTTILDVVQDPETGEYTSIQMSANASSGGSGTITAEPFGTQDVIGLLLTANNGTSAAVISNSSAIQPAAQNAISPWHTILNVGTSAMQTDGSIIRASFVTAATGRVISVESSTFSEVLTAANTTVGNGILFSTVTASGSMISVSGGSMLHAINVASGTITGAVLNSAVDAPINLGGAVGAGSTYVQLFEQSADPAAPAANAVRWFARDSGAGKTQLCARFSSGAVQVIATQP